MYIILLRKLKVYIILTLLIMIISKIYKDIIPNDLALFVMSFILSILLLSIVIQPPVSEKFENQDTDQINDEDYRLCASNGFWVKTEQQKDRCKRINPCKINCKCDDGCIPYEASASRSGRPGIKKMEFTPLSNANWENDR